MPPSDWHELVAAHAAADIQVTQQTAITRWTGEALDLGLAVEWLMQNDARQEGVSAETS